MSDLRIKYLKLTDSRRSGNSAVVASIFTYVTVVGLALEKNNTHNIPLRLWLVGVLVQIVVRLIAKVMLVRMQELGNLATHEDIWNVNRTVDNLENFSYAWFAVGNILFLENYECRTDSPFVYFLCVMYFSVMYTSLVIFHVIQVSLIVYPPTSTVDRIYWVQNRFIYPDNDMNDLIPTLQAYASGDKLSSSMGLTSQQSLFWIEWLESHGCVAGVYNPASQLTRATSSTEYSIHKPTAGSDSSRELTQHSPTRDNCIDKHDQDEPLITDPLELNTRTKAKVDVKNDNVSEQSISIVDSELCVICLSSLTYLSASASAHSIISILSSDSNSGSYSGSKSLCSTHKTAPRGLCDNIVRYPCQGRHYFHADCLHNWLQTASERRWDPATGENIAYALCPCCRQPPVLE